MERSKVRDFKVGDKIKLKLRGNQIVEVVELLNEEKVFLTSPILTKGGWLQPSRLNNPENYFELIEEEKKEKIQQNQLLARFQRLRYDL